MSRAWVATVVATVALSAPLPAQHSAARRIRAVVFSGELLVRRIAILDTVTVDALLSTVHEAMTDPSRDLDYRPYIDVALFDAVPTSAAMPLEGVPLDRADQHARFYPAYGDEAPFWVFLDGADAASPIRYVLQTGLDLLQRHAVPIRARPGG